MARAKKTAKKSVKKAAGKVAKTGKPPLHGDSAWFVHDRLGMFIHWGTYALPARHEWVKTNERIPEDKYQLYFDLFDPDLYDPKAWAKAAREAGMKYFVITTKHHEGFCLWDSKYTDYKATNTPHGRDLLRPMVDAFRAEGLRVGFYYSLIDWHHPDFPIDRLHPRRDDEAFKAANANRDVSKYAAYMRNQVTELLTQFGQIDYLFFDFSYPGEGGKGRDDWESEKLMKLCRTLQPQILLDNRLDLADVPGGWDVLTPEQHMEKGWPMVDGKPALWETCQTFSGAWGYHRDETTWKDPKQLLFLLIDTVSKGGNLLLNVGPTARGTFDDRALNALAGMGEWARLHGRGIYGCTQAPKDIPCPADCRLTWNPDTRRLYVHLLNWPIGVLHMAKVADKIKYAQLLCDASELHFAADANTGDVSINLPVRKPNTEIPVIELYLK